MLLVARSAVTERWSPRQQALQPLFSPHVAVFTGYRSPAMEQLARRRSDAGSMTVTSIRGLQSMVGDNHAGLA
jgi:hypothetical protein